MLTPVYIIHGSGLRGVTGLLARLRKCGTGMGIAKNPGENIGFTKQAAVQLRFS